MIEIAIGLTFLLLVQIEVGWRQAWRFTGARTVFACSALLVGLGVGRTLLGMSLL